MKSKPFPALLLCVLAGVAPAANVPQNLCDASIATYYNQFGNVPASPPPLVAAFDGDESTAPAISVYGASIVLDFTQLNYPEGKTTVYADSIEIVHSGNANLSLYTSDDGTTWTAVPDAENVRPAAGLNIYRPKVRARYVKYVFESASGDDLKEFRVKGWMSSEPDIVSSYAKTTWFNSNGSAMDANGGGGTGNPANVFNGRFGDYQMFPRCGDNGYFILDLSDDFPNGCYLENVIVDTTGEKRYSVLYTEDGSTWKTLVDKQKAAGKTTYNAGFTAKQVKYVFNDGSMWDYSTQYFAEFQVWGMDVDDLPCTHPSIEPVPWVAVPDSATCTAKGLDERFCPDCGERFTKISDDPPLGHDYVSTLARPGGFKKFGAGSITCSRCDYRIDFSNIPETAETNGPIDLVTVGGLAMENLVQFTDVTVTSTDHTEWGPNPAKIIDGSWTEWWVSYWVSAGLNNQYADFDFGTTIDLTKIMISVKDVNQTFQFFDVDDATGEETQIVQFGVIRTDLDAGYQYHEYRPEGVDPPKDYGDSKEDYWDELVVEDDPGVPANQKDEDGNDVLNSKGETIVNCFQTFTVRFFEQPCKHLRIRCPQSDYSLWSGRSMCLIECHPWGIVRGASETRYRKESLMILR